MQYQVIDKVWRWYAPQAKAKLGLGWTGPYVVTQKVTDVTYRIEHFSNKRKLVAHVDHLKPYINRNDTQFANEQSTNLEDSDIQYSSDPNIRHDYHAYSNIPADVHTDSDLKLKWMSRFPRLLM